ncbi:NAD(P)/FAD-dependent oxidoreductase [Riemerella columbipharyngis]|uniref:Glycine/D-amino acid oxidase n=1 Tax=Riemerella columbipharyngis TaxID=1071918 RepID=A0A1G7B4H2_9FLAO|nr:FAD-dependent oxidoreductase [Riemerella columbipharyngis]SDE22028.1 Glycine/D-amino acid oxidase [Riemerella columbipharyngis]
MMKTKGYIIVGGGYAAMFYAHRLIKNNKSFVVFYDGERGASQVSAGIINPVVLKKFTTFWKAAEQISALEETLEEMKQYTKESFLIKAPIHRIFHDEQEKKLWLKKYDENPKLKHFLSPNFSYIEGVENPFGTGMVEHSARLDVNNFFHSMLGYLQEQGCLIQEKFIYDRLDMKQSVYDGIRFKNILFAEGIKVRENPYFNDLDIRSNKGHHINIKLSKAVDSSLTIKKKHFLFSNEQEFCYYGGTYDRENTNEGIDEKAVSQLEQGLSEFYKHDYELLSAHYGFRPTVKDRRPLVGRHRYYDNMFIFNGLGARGILNGNYFSELLYQNIEHNVPLPEEVGVYRFNANNQS